MQIRTPNPTDQSKNDSERIECVCVGVCVCEEGRIQKDVLYNHTTLDLSSKIAIALWMG